MTIHLPLDLESSIQDAVRHGRFASLDEAMAQAARLLLNQLEQDQSANPAEAADSPDPLLGLWQDYTDEMDEIVSEAYRKRREEPWRKFDV
jgi:Arc/MetJ-type ribon-helix-helix transcriptional regulator